MSHDASLSYKGCQLRLCSTREVANSRKRRDLLIVLEYLSEPDVRLQVFERDALRLRPNVDVLVGHTGMSLDHLVELELETRRKVGKRCWCWKSVSSFLCFR